MLQYPVNIQACAICEDQNVCVTREHVCMMCVCDVHVCACVYNYVRDRNLYTAMNNGQHVLHNISCLRTCVIMVFTCIAPGQ